MQQTDGEGISILSLNEAGVVVERPCLSRCPYGSFFVPRHAVPPFSDRFHLHDLCVPRCARAYPPDRGFSSSLLCSHLQTASYLSYDHLFVAYVAELLLPAPLSPSRRHCGCRRPGQCFAGIVYSAWAHRFGTCLGLAIRDQAGLERTTFCKTSRAQRLSSTALLHKHP
jgi:hypothetical protein